MRHRGPDEGGHRRIGAAELVFRRLALLDMAGGSQPASDEDGRYWSVFNGEVYNFEQLRRELLGLGHQIAGHGDAALIPHLYEQWGASFLHRLRGMFALAVYDRDREELFLARDRFGIKPLFVLRTSAHVIFASEARTVMAAAGRLDMDPEALWHYLTFGYVPDPATPWCDLVKVPPGHHVVARRGDLVTTRWWHPTMQPAGTSAAGAEAVDAALRDSVTAHLTADVPVGAYLSSGVDSSLLAALAAQRVPLKTFSIGFEGAVGSLDELTDARDLAARLGTDHHEEVISEHDYLAALPEIVSAQEGPLADPSAPALWFLARAASSSVKAVLSGEGADELFAGYPIFRQAQALRAFELLPEHARELAHRLARHLPAGVKGTGFVQRGTAPLAQRFVGNAPLFDEEDKRSLMPRRSGVVASHELVAPLYAAARGQPTLVQMQLVALQTWLPSSILMKADKMAMAHSLEVRVPFLDPAVYDVAASLPLRDRINRRATKVALRAAAAKYLPADNAARPKLGFPVPFRGWLDGSVGEWLHDAVADLDDPMLDRGAVRHVLADERRPDRHRRAWALLVYLLWRDQFVRPADVRLAGTTAV